MGMKLLPLRFGVNRVNSLSHKVRVKFHSNLIKADMGGDYYSNSNERLIPNLARLTSHRQLKICHKIAKDKPIQINTSKFATVKKDLLRHRSEIHKLSR